MIVIVWKQIVFLQTYAYRFLFSFRCFHQFSHSFLDNSDGWTIIDHDTVFEARSMWGSADILMYSPKLKFSPCQATWPPLWRLCSIMLSVIVDSLWHICKSSKKGSSNINMWQKHTFLHISWTYTLLPSANLSQLQLVRYLQLLWHTMPHSMYDSWCHSDPS